MEEETEHLEPGTTEQPLTDETEEAFSAPGQTEEATPNLLRQAQLEALRDHRAAENERARPPAPIEYDSGDFDDRPRRDAQTSEPQRDGPPKESSQGPVVGFKRVLLIAVMATILGAGIGTAMTLLIGEPGPRGERGPAGPQGNAGPIGPQGDSSAAEAAVNDLSSQVDDISARVDSLESDVPVGLGSQVSDLDNRVSDLENSLSGFCLDLSLNFC